MFALQDHLPLDRIITRFSAPTTITQFQRSSSDGILIELARLVTHGLNDNICCLSGLIKSTGGVERMCWCFKAVHEKRTRCFWFVPTCALLPALFVVVCGLGFSNNARDENHRPCRSYLSQLIRYILHHTLRGALPCKCSCKLRAVQAWCMVGGGRVCINTPGEPTTTSHSSAFP